MASHFRSTERQGSEDAERKLDVIVSEAAPQEGAPSPDDTGAFLAAATVGSEDAPEPESPEAVHVVTASESEGAPEQPERSSSCTSLALTPRASSARPRTFSPAKCDRCGAGQRHSVSTHVGFDWSIR